MQSVSLSCEIANRAGLGGFGHPPEVIGRPDKDWEGDDFRHAIAMELPDGRCQFLKPGAPGFHHQEDFVFLGEFALPDEERPYLGDDVHTRGEPVLDQAPSDAFRFLARGHRDQDHDGVLPLDDLHLFSTHRLTSLSCAAQPPPDGPHLCVLHRLTARRGWAYYPSARG